MYVCFVWARASLLGFGVVAVMCVVACCKNICVVDQLTGRFRLGLLLRVQCMHVWMDVWMWVCSHAVTVRCRCCPTLCPAACWTVDADTTNNAMCVGCWRRYRCCCCCCCCCYCCCCCRCCYCARQYYNDEYLLQLNDEAQELKRVEQRQADAQSVRWVPFSQLMLFRPLSNCSPNV